ncbi:hypothetical protein BDZ97DRAFT_520744 [Flammula alnicola]|nr:hypothetical protein BDZ97DRAFT_520744 [Flammula alnicola]
MRQQHAICGFKSFPIYTFSLPAISLSCIYCMLLAFAASTITSDPAYPHQISLHSYNHWQCSFLIAAPCGCCCPLLPVLISSSSAIMHHPLHPHCRHLTDSLPYRPLMPYLVFSQGSPFGALAMAHLPIIPIVSDRHYFLQFTIRCLHLYAVHCHRLLFAVYDYH